MELEKCKLCGRQARDTDWGSWVKCSAVFDRDEGPECPAAGAWVKPELWNKLNTPSPSVAALVEDMVPRSRYDACNQDWLEARAEIERIKAEAAKEIARLEEALANYKGV